MKNSLYCQGLDDHPAFQKQDPRSNPILRQLLEQHQVAGLPPPQPDASKGSNTINNIKTVGVVGVIAYTAWWFAGLIRHKRIP